MGTTLIVIALLALLGFFFGAIKFFREEKQKAYRELLPPIIRWSFRPTEGLEKEFNEATCKLLLYGNKDVAKKLDPVLSIMIKPSRGDLIKAYQELIAAMREDIQILPWQRLKPEKIKHFYSFFEKKSK